MAERIIPGTYITVRSEGLISARRIATGIVGIVGTARSGPIDVPTTLSSLAEAGEIFGSPDDYDRPESGSSPLTLTRALEFLYGNGASSVIAVRVADADATAATLALHNAQDQAVVTLEARTPGTWGNDILVTVQPSSRNCQIDETYTEAFAALRYTGIVKTPQNQLRVYRGATRRMETLALVYAEKAVAAPGQVVVNVTTGALTFAAGQQPNADQGDKLLASYLIDKQECVEITLTYGTTVERVVAPDGIILADLINRQSRLVRAEVASGSAGRLRPGTKAFMGTGSNTSGNSGAGAGAQDYARGLSRLEHELVNIVVLAGQDARVMGTVLADHLNATQDEDFERIGIIGAAGETVADFLGHDVAHERIVLAAPGLAYPDGRQLPAGYTAAAVAGRISALDVQSSLTNKPLSIPGLALTVNRGQQEQLLRRNVLTVIRKEGYRVLKGITTAGEGTPFASIPTRRIVDYAKYGVRSGANPYIGRLNNDRVRAALKATLDAFLTGMVEDEALTGYELEVSATRAQEIAGEVSVVMTIQPTFSIDYIRVVMNLK